MHCVTPSISMNQLEAYAHRALSRLADAYLIRAACPALLIYC